MVFKGLAAAAAALALSLPVALAADPARIAPGQRVDLKVLLLSADGTEPGFGAWKAQLEREGVPYTALIATQSPPLDDAQLADYGSNHALYQAVITATGDLGTPVTNLGGTTSYLSALSDAEWAALAKFERTFGIRRLSDYTAPTPAHGLAPATGAPQDGQVGTLTAAGRAAFPYLRGPVAIANDDPLADETFGYPAVPDPQQPGAWQTLLDGPNGTVYLGIYTRPDDGREEMVMTVASNQFQNHNQLLRHGMLNWVTRGVYLGYERNYLELDVDDIFLPDDKWNADANVTDYSPESAIRMTPADVDNAVAWQRQTGLRMNMVYNMGGIEEFGGGAANDQLLAQLRIHKNEFRWINHTLQHPNLDCTTSSYTRNQLTQNQTLFDGLLGPVNSGLNDRTEAITGEHSGLANVRPGNPGTIDPPRFNDALPTVGGTLAPGTYEYAITANSSATGETVASTAQVPVAAPNNAVQLTFNAVCHAVAFNLYRRTAPSGAWARVGGLNRLARDPVDDGADPIEHTITDTGATVAAGTQAPPSANTALLEPYTQNPIYVAALTGAGITTVATDSSKGYPNPPQKPTVSDADPTNFPKGATFPVGPGIQAVPRYPSNIYYNVASRADQLDEYNWIYTSPPIGACVDIPGVTTCRTTPATWADYLASETRIMFGHLMGNDPRPHYFHQTNIAQSNLAAADTDTSVGGILYAAVNTLLKRYDAGFDRTSTPIVQLTQAQIAQTLVRQDAWSAARANVSAWVQDGRVYVKNAGAAAVEVPLTGTTAGAPYGGQRSGWISLAPGAEASYAPLEPANTQPPAVKGTPRVGEKLTAEPGAWTGSPSLVYQWQRCDKTCANVAKGASYDLTEADKGHTMRVAVLAGNWVASVSQAFSLPTGAIAAKPETPRSEDRTPGAGSPRGEAERGSTRAKLRLTKLKMSPRRFAVAHRRLPKGTKLDGSRVSWKLNRAATVRLTFQRHTRRGWVRVGVITRASKAGVGVVRFRGRFGSRPLKPQRYRVVVVASGSGDRTAARRVGFRVLKG